jgi:hypothetical protein
VNMDMLQMNIIQVRAGVENLEYNEHYTRRTKKKYVEMKMLIVECIDFCLWFLFCFVYPYVWFALIAVANFADICPMEPNDNGNWIWPWWP